MSVTTISGVVSKLRHTTETQIATSQYGADVIKTRVITFRVGDRSSQIKLQNMPDIQNGDQVTIAGKDKNGIFNGLALRNDDTGAIYFHNDIFWNYALGAILIGFGLLTFIFLIGIIILGFGLFCIHQANSTAQAVKMLRQ